MDLAGGSPHTHTYADTHTCAHAHTHTRTPLLPLQGDEFAVALAEGNATLLKGDKLSTLRLTACNLSDEGACRLAKALESVGEWCCCVREGGLAWC